MEILGIDFAYRLIKISDLQLMKTCITFAPETKYNDNKKLTEVNLKLQTNMSQI
jgi:hypothetical protein